MNYLGINIDNQPVELPDRANLGLSVSYILEDADQFQQKSGSPAFNINIPATPANDQIFNTYHNPNVEDMSGTDAFTNPRKCEIIVGGVTILKGKSLLQDASHTRIAAGYNINAYGQNGDWVIEMKDLSLWDCLNTATHTFDVLTVEASWGAYNIDEYNDYVYAPVRYRQPFGNNDDAVNIYHLRPSISIYWLLVRGFRQFGYTIDSEFFQTSYFQGLVMPWTHGDFYDINGQIIEALLFKASGLIPTVPPNGFGIPTGYTEWIFLSGAALSIKPCLDADNTGWSPFLSGISSTSIGALTNTGYVQSMTEVQTGTTIYQNFKLANIAPPHGYENLALYSFDDSTGAMRYTFSPPAEIAAYFSGPVSINFTLNLICKVKCQSSAGSNHANLFIEVKINGGAPTYEPIPELSTTTSGATVGSLLYPTVHSFTVNGVNVGDVVVMRIYYDLSSRIDDSIQIISSGYVNVDPGTIGANSWQYNFVTGRMENIPNNGTTTQWQEMYSSIEMTGFQLQVGGTVDFKLYDKFRDYRFMDMLGGLTDMFNLSIQTDPINKIVTIEPTHEYSLQGIGDFPGYFKPERIDWTNKQDLVQPNTMNLYSDCERQFDFQFKVDGSDGMQNIYAARYKGIYLANKIANSFNRLNNTNNENGVKAGVPGASRYVFPERFRKGSRQLTNRFFSATMHYNHTSFKRFTNVAPQFIAIIPENINDSSASAVSAIFEPKIAFYKGYVDRALYGGWRYIGDPNAHGVGNPTYTDATGATTFDFPFMFSVNYGYQGGLDPVLSYCRQKLNTGGGTGPVPGLMETFFLRRLAIMRHGRQYKPWIRLNSGDMTDWEHRNTIIIGSALYYLIGVDRWNPLSDNPAQCTLWKVAHIEGVDYENIYPSILALSGATVLSQFDLRYAKLLMFPSDIPQVL